MRPLGLVTPYGQMSVAMSRDGRWSGKLPVFFAQSFWRRGRLPLYLSHAQGAQGLFHVGLRYGESNHLRRTVPSERVAVMMNPTLESLLLVCACVRLL